MRLLKLASILAFVFLISAPLAYAQQADDSMMVTSPTPQNLNAITPGGLLDMDVAWAVGDAGTIIRWNGDQSWDLVTSPTTANLYSVSMASASDAWAVGGSGSNGVIIRWDGSNWNTWNNVTLGTSGQDAFPALHSVSMLDSSFGWAVGDSGTMLVWDGTEWAGAVNLAPGVLRSVAIVTTTDAWAVGDNGLIMRWTGLNWENIQSPTNANLYSVFMYDANNGWAVGGQLDTGVILHWDGTSWTRWTQIALYHPDEPSDDRAIPPSAFVDSVNATLYSVFVCDTGEGWAAGSSGMVLTWNGTIWYGSGNEFAGTLRGIAVVDPEYVDGESKGYAVGDGGVILGWESHQWIPELSILMVVPMLFGVAMLAIFLKLRSFKKTNSPLFPS